METKWIKNAAGRLVPDRVNGESAIPFMGVGKYRAEGKKEYADYIERAYYNGYLAQQNRYTGENTYFLPHRAGARKKWSTITDSMYCCNGTQVQAHASGLAERLDTRVQISLSARKGRLTIEFADADDLVG
ncbi:MAG: hypothetical protein EOM73_03380, partial [Bacteroidia bacterium]|nr:hypothetical protein [Bacteroidia bacterium]